MAFETPLTPIDRSDEALEAAKELVAENKLLSENPRVQALMANEFITEDGRELDPGNFLASMLNYIESQEPGTVTNEDIAEAIERNLVQHSRPQETEKRSEEIDYSKE